MIEEVERLVRRHHETGVVVDTNLVLLWFVGDTEESLIEEHKRTNKYVVEDFRLLNSLLSRFVRVMTTSNIMTEVSNLVSQIANPHRSRLLATFRTRVGPLRESYFATAGIAQMDRFELLELADCGLLRLARKGRLVLTDDFRLYGAIAAENAPVINFSHIRTLTWDL